VITECQVKVRPRPEVETFRGAFLPGAEAGIAAVRALAQSRVDLSMVRLSLPRETAATMALAGRAGSRSARLLDGYLRLRRVGDDRCMLVYGASGGSRHAAQALAEAGASIRSHSGVLLGRVLGQSWERSRFRNPYFRNHLWAAGLAIDTLETAVPWGEVPALIAGVEGALGRALEATGERVVAFTHLSHVYPHGSSCYTTYGFRLAADPEVSLARWRACKTAASDAIVAHGGTISHQHGVGLDHKPWLEAEKGALGLEVLRDVFARFDPDGLHDNGNLVDRRAAP
jgi:alkyldihydroxyacetonephosphate synthase